MPDMAKLPEQRDWTDDELEAAAYGDGVGISKTATARDGRTWRLKGDHRVDNQTGPLHVDNPITGEFETLSPVPWEYGTWARSTAPDIWTTESGYIVVLRRYTRGAGTRGYGIEYAGPFKTATRAGGPPKVLPVADAWNESEPETDADDDEDN